MDRVDLEEVKANLFGNLSRETADDYWTCLRAFLAAKLTKYEFDCQIYAILEGRQESVALHNHLIRSLIRNAYNAVPSFAVPSSGLKRESDAAAGAPSAKRLKTAAAAAAKAAAAPGASSIVHHLRLAHDFGGATSPSSWALRNRMYKIATEAGLTEISPEAVNLMTHAMEHHLKDILDACKRTKTLTPSGLATAASSTTTSPASTASARSFSPHTVFNQPEGNTISARDMLTMVQHRPYLLGEDLPVNQERILLIQEDY
ncbi:uncharacterized protein ACA1_322150 [Acanthamoeba castellanii str. Neff]|uniref:Uncharacterized protein n=1 Tax=Acanthamoeba castellanii (strain ATCC 30010 / Neff) TaxID=1257118 RepID=L8GN10_ACACF|nr:uncharacterized protein ACA1_322150 [Acanthamoeba castellanii str. Neff]ELR14118.1 hypothetical protein ACA1_322150 [Acanthamoeba castellanii str. Neff]